jgi:hypothetical protein
MPCFFAISTSTSISTAEGRGRKRHRLPEPDEAGGVAMAEEGLVYFLGGKLFDLGEITGAAETLGRKVAAAVRPLLNDE